MIRNTLVAAAVAAIGFTLPASAASMSCSGPNLTKAGTTVEAMADGPNRRAAFHEMSAAQEDLLAGKTGSCARHIAKVMQMGVMRPSGM